MSALDSEEKRLALFARLLALSVLLCMGFCPKLWISSRLYPLVPLLDFVAPFPYPLDYIFIALVCAALLGVVLRPGSRVAILGVLAGFAVLFLQDRGRMWPSFYEFFFLFLLLGACKGGGEAQAQHVLAGARFVMAAVYFWSGFQKLNTRFYYETFPWFIEPLTDRLPFDVALPPVIGLAGAVLEALFGLGLLTRRFRALSLCEAMLMHVLIFFLIGPFRGNWNNSAWAWSAVTAALVWVLFYKAPAFRFGDMFAAAPLCSAAQALAAVFIGLLPLLNNVNRWDSALSFNIYTGNVNTAYIRMRIDAARNLPAELAPFVSERYGLAELDIGAWTAHEFNAHPIGEEAVMKAVLRVVCSYAPDTSVNLVLKEKSGWFGTGSVKVHACERLGGVVSPRCGRPHAQSAENLDSCLPPRRAGAVGRAGGEAVGPHRAIGRRRLGDAKNGRG